MRLLDYAQIRTQGRRKLAVRQVESKPRIGKAKRFKRLALRCEKTARNYAAIVALVFMFILVQSVHTA